MKKALIIGAGPAGLTAAHEMLKRTDIKPIVLEATDSIGGISRTVEFNGNRIDIGGHRFFSKSDRVMQFWNEVFPVEGERLYQGDSDRLFLVRSRVSRIFFLGRFFSYPVKPDLDTLKKLGIIRVAKIGLSYLNARLFPVKDERNLEDFFINRFGSELYRIFFEDYTRKVWGVPCREIPPDWGAQRVKGLSAGKALLQAIKPRGRNSSIEQKDVETSLIEKFLYPKYGPGQFWEELAGDIAKRGGEIRKNCRVNGCVLSGRRIKGLCILDEKNNKVYSERADYILSSMPVKELISGMEGDVPPSVLEVARGLIYRDFMTCGILLDRMKVKGEKNSRLRDNWIYIQERDIKAGRLQIFNNWSPYMVKDPSKILLGMEYFVSKGDEYWSMEDSDFSAFAVSELEKMGFADKKDVLDTVVIRIPRAYPSYLGTYGRFHEIRAFTDRIENLFLIGRNGMHRYNNSDHSSLTAMVAVDNIAKNSADKENIWQVNAERDYHEKK